MGDCNSTFHGFSSPKEALSHYYETVLKGRHTEGYEYNCELKLLDWLYGQEDEGKDKSSMNVVPRFIKVVKANSMRDRGLIAVDSICAVFEDKTRHLTEVMTIDGFWYEVEDGIENFISLLAKSKPVFRGESKGNVRKKVSPWVSEQVNRQHHERMVYKKPFRAVNKVEKGPNNLDLPSGGGKGHDAEQNDLDNGSFVPGL